MDERVFREEEAFFGQNDKYSTQIVLWASPAQALQDGKGVACASGRGEHCDVSAADGTAASLREPRRLLPGPRDHLITWTRPPRPPWMSPGQ